MKILESSQTLLHVLKKEDSTLNKRKNNVSTRRAGAGGNAANKENMYSASQINHSPEIKRTARGNSANKYIPP